MNSVEPAVDNVVLIDAFHQDEEWAKQRRPGAAEFARKRLAATEEALGSKPFLTGETFTYADIVMASVTRPAAACKLLEGLDRLDAYKARCEERPAWAKVLQEQEERCGAKAQAS